MTRHARRLPHAEIGANASVLAFYVPVTGAVRPDCRCQASSSSPLQGRVGAGLPAELGVPLVGQKGEGAYAVEMAVRDGGHDDFVSLGGLLETFEALDDCRRRADELARHAIVYQGIVF